MSATLAKGMRALPAASAPAVTRSGAGGWIVALSLILFAAVGPLFPTNDLKTDATVLAGSVLSVGLYMWWRSGALPRRSALDAPLLALLGAATLSTVFSVDRFLSFFPSTRRGEGLVVFGIALLMALAAARLDRRQTAVVVGSILVVGTAIALIAIAQFYGTDPAAWVGFRAVTQNEFYNLPAGPSRSGPLYGLRSHGTLGNPVFLGGYLVLLLPLAGTIAMGARRRWWLYAIAATCLYGALIASQTRAAWIAAVLAGVVAIVRVPPAERRWGRLALLATLFVVITVGMPLTQPGAALSTRAASALDPGDKALAERLYLWKHTLPLVAQRPVLGWGFSTLLGRFPDLGSAEYVRVYGWHSVGIDSPHNDLLHVAYSIGLVGLAAYAWLWIRLLRLLAAGSPLDTEGSRLGVALLAALIGYAVWLQSAWNHIGPAQVFWTLAGVAAAVTGGGAGRGATGDAARAKSGVA